MDEQTAGTLGELLSQSFDIFNTYGKDAEAFRSMYNAFKEELSGFSQESITRGFKEWLGSKSVMPTPADIKGLITFTGIKRQRRPDDEVVTWGPGEREEWIRKNRKGVVPWHNKMWVNIPHMHSEIKAHIQKLAKEKSVDRAKDYCKFLHDKTGAPKTLAYECGLVE